MNIAFDRFRHPQKQGFQGFNPRYSSPMHLRKSSSSTVCS